MISRVASNCFWLNRYIERVEVLARLQDVNMAFQLDVHLPRAERWRPLVIVTGQEAHYLEAMRDRELDDAYVAQHYLTWNTENGSSIYSSLQSARENARTIRETISLEMWESINDLWLWAGGSASRRLFEEDRHAFYRHLKQQCLLFHGAAEATMLHDEPFRFMRLGTTLERTQQTARILDVKHHSMGPGDDVEMPSEAAQWLATLRFCSGVEPFFKRELQTFSGRAVAEFLLFDKAFPRSVACNLERSRNLLRLIRMKGSEIGQRSTYQIESMLARLKALEEGAEPLGDLHALFTWIVDSATAASQLVDEEFFDPAPPTLQQRQSQT
jgi:uncharacterized alpha-E superfamily protein